MLTLLETTNAIQALDTEPDIIAGACKKVLGQDHEVAQEPREIAREIINTYIDKVLPKNLCIAGALIAGRVAGVMTKQGKEIEMAKHLSEIMFGEIIEISHHRLAKLAETDLEVAIKGLIAQLQEVTK